MNRLKVKELKEMAKVTGKKMEKSRRMLACLVLYISMQMNTMICYAATDTVDSNSVTNGLTTLKDLILGVIGIAGLIYLGKSVAEFATAYQQADSSGMNTAVKGIVGGAMMAGITGIIKLLGF